MKDQVGQPDSALAEHYYGARISGPLKLKTKKERVEDIAWIPDSYNQIVAVTEKMIRVYDIGRVEEDIGHVAVHKDKTYSAGIMFDPTNPKRFLTTHGSEVAIWDLAALKEPIVTFRNPAQEASANLCIEWFAEQEGLVVAGACGKGSDATVNYWHLRNALARKDAGPVRPVKTKVLAAGESISSFAGIPGSADLLTVFRSVKVICDDSCRGSSTSSPTG